MDNMTAEAKGHDPAGADIQASAGTSFWRILFTAFLYWSAGKLALLLAIPPGYATAVWPSAGLALVCVLFFGIRGALGVLLGSVLVNIGTSFDSTSAATILQSTAIAVAIGMGAALQALVGSRLIRWLVGFPTALEAQRDILWFMLLGGPISCLSSSLVGVVTLGTFGIIPWTSAVFHWWTWWVGDTIGVAIFAPMALLFAPSPYPIWRQRRASLSIPLLLGFLGVTALFWRASFWEESRLKADFDRRAQPIARSIEVTLSQHQEVIESIVSFFRASAFVSRGEFREFCQKALQKHQGIRALSWNPRIDGDGREQFEASVRQGGMRDFEIKEKGRDGGLKRAEGRPEYLPIMYLEPTRGNSFALGFDAASDPIRFEAFKRARDTGIPTASSRIELVQDPDGPLGVLLVAPVPARVPLGAETSFFGNLLGFAVGVFRLQDAITTATHGLDQNGLDILLWDESADEANRLLYSSSKSDALLSRLNNRNHSIDRQWTETFVFGGRIWKLEVAASAAYLTAHRSWQAWMVLVAGLLFVGMLGIVMLITTGRASTLRQSAERFRALVDASAQIVWTAAPDGALTEDSPSWRAFTGQSYAQLKNRGWFEAFHPDDRERAGTIWQRAIATKAPIDAELRIRHETGEWRWTSARAIPLLDNRGALRGWVGMNIDITDRKRAEEEKNELMNQLVSLNTRLEARVEERTAEISKALAEREVLIREIHHRVKNNLQVVISLINMQIRKVEPGANRDALQECQNRVRAIALIHEKLYRSTDFAHIPFSEYARELATTIFHTIGTSPGTVSLELAIDKVVFAVDKAIPCGLILNELITNALKHAFKDGRPGTIHVELLRLDAERVRLTVRDNGIGLGDEAQIHKSGALGLQLVHTLADQIEAELIISSQSGASFALTFPATE
jgi:PAS domain S-box-containing protein